MDLALNNQPTHIAFNFLTEMKIFTKLHWKNCISLDRDEKFKRIPQINSLSVLLRWKSMPYGLMTVNAIFQKAVELVQGKQYIYIYIYIYIVIHRQTVSFYQNSSVIYIIGKEDDKYIGAITEIELKSKFILRVLKNERLMSSIIY